MTATNELIARTIREIESRPGYNYDPKIVEQIIAAGELADGTVFLSSSKGDVTYFAAEIRLIKDGKIVQTMPVTEQTREAALIAHAKNASRKGHMVGGF